MSEQNPKIAGVVALQRVYQTALDVREVVSPLRDGVLQAPAVRSVLPSLAARVERIVAEADALLEGWCRIQESLVDAWEAWEQAQTGSADSTRNDG